MARWHSCNVLQIAPDGNRLWQFDAKGGGFALAREHRGQTLPARGVVKSWSSLWQPKLNIAWLPPENVFLRVIEVPVSNFDETLSMVELQLEKVSPLPVTQVVWTMHILPGPPAAAPARAPSAGETPAAAELQTIIVAIVARSAVEELLGKLEGQGYLADRLEVPMLDQLEAAAADGSVPQRQGETNVWVYPVLLGGQTAALVAWWCGGRLRSLSFVALPPGDDRTQALKGQLAQLAWAGELDGWLSASPRWHLVADPVNAAEWEKMLGEALGEPMDVSAPLAPAELAGHTARRAAAGSSRANLLPPEFSGRYHQQFVDRLWLRGLLATGVLYAVGVVIYFCAVGLLNYKTQGVESQVAQLSGSYTNALQLKARYAVLKEREDLKYAALDCWKIIAEQLPEGLSLQRLSFANGSKLSLAGVCAQDQIGLISDKGGFYDLVRKVQVNGQPMFSQNTPSSDQLIFRLAGKDQQSWNFAVELQHAEGEPQ
ncbi:MAG: hypothetical protein ABSE16_09430 [Verrucomicrobiota bacterium]|jgi:hypothetical protein